MAEVQAWITINGQHIPIMKGESKTAAVAKYIKGKRDKKKEDKLYEKTKENYRGLEKHGRKRKYGRGVILGDEELYNVARAQAENQYNKDTKKKDIKGRAETKNEKLDKLFDKAADLEADKDYLFTKGSLREYQNAKIKYEMANKRYEKLKNEKTKTYKLKEDKKVGIPKKRTYIRKGNTIGEKKVLDAIKVSSSKYNLGNVKVVITPRGDLNIRTKSGNHDIVTLRRSYFSDKDIDDLRDMGYIK